jgi:adenosylmethionine-8-amino-7-oxononanoate aminotransferase
LGVQRDIICFAKVATSGYLPLGEVVASGKVAEPFWMTDAPALQHGATYAGHATCCAAALANLDLLELDDLYRRAQTLEADFQADLAPLTDDPLIAEVRAGMGFDGWDRADTRPA